MKSLIITRSNKFWPIIFLLLFASSSCTVRLIAPYDSMTDQKTVELHEKIALEFKKWEREIPTFEASKSFYDNIEVNLEILIDRNKAIPESEIVTKQLELILKNIKQIKKYHDGSETPALSKALLSEVSPDINSQFIAIQKFLMALKRAEEK